MVKLPNRPARSKILYTSMVAAIVNLLVYFDVIPLQLQEPTIALINTGFLVIISYFRAFKTLDPESIKILENLDFEK